MEDETLKRAVVRSLEIIGEATKKIPADIKVKWNDEFNNLMQQMIKIIFVELWKNHVND